MCEKDQTIYSLKKYIYFLVRYQNSNVRTLNSNVPNLQYRISLLFIRIYKLPLTTLSSANKPSATHYFVQLTHNWSTGNYSMSIYTVIKLTWREFVCESRPAIDSERLDCWQTYPASSYCLENEYTVLFNLHRCSA